MRNYVLCPLRRPHFQSPEPPRKKSTYHETTKQERLCGETKPRQRGVPRSPNAPAAPAPSCCVFPAQVPDTWENKPLQWRHPSHHLTAASQRLRSRTALPNCSGISDPQKPLLITHDSSCFKPLSFWMNCYMTINNQNNSLPWKTPYLHHTYHCKITMCLSIIIPYLIAKFSWSKTIYYYT